MAVKKKPVRMTATKFLATEHKKKPVSPYDDSNMKKAAGLVVKLDSGISTLMFPEGCRWRWRKIADERMLEIFSGDTVLAQIKQHFVVYVTGPQTIFRDAEWR